MPKRNPAVNPTKSKGLKATLTADKGFHGDQKKGAAAPTFGGGFGAKKGN